MEALITKDVTNPKFFLVIVDGHHAFGIRLHSEARRALAKLGGDVQVQVEGGTVMVAGRALGEIVGWNGQPLDDVDPEAAWSIRTASGRAGRLGRALKKAVDENRLSAEEATAWVRRYLGEDEASELENLLDGNDEDIDLTELLKQHLLQDDLPW